MKQAKLHIAVIEFTCPDCGEYISSPDHYSQMFEILESFPDTLECDCCHKLCQVPKAKIEKLRGQK